MRDQHDDRLYQAVRHDLNRDVARLVGSIAYAFDRLNARLYDAPWLRSRQAVGRECGKGFTTV